MFPAVQSHESIAFEDRLLDIAIEDKDDTLKATSFEQLRS